MKRGFDRLSLSGGRIDFKRLFPLTLSPSKGALHLSTVSAGEGQGEGDDPDQAPALRAGAAYRSHDAHLPIALIGVICRSTFSD
jgi:hypothetical protein